MTYYDDDGQYHRVEQTDDAPAMSDLRRISPRPASERAPWLTSAVDRLLADGPGGLGRVKPEDLADQVAAGALLVDLRPKLVRSEEGGCPAR